MSDDNRTIEQKLDSFVDGNLRPWLHARLSEARSAGVYAAYTSDEKLEEVEAGQKVPRVITAEELEARIESGLAQSVERTIFVIGMRP